MIFSRPAQYAIRAMTYLGGQEAGKLSSIREISREAEVPLPYLAKIINRLSRSKLVRAQRGPSGGVMLGRPASRIRVEDIISAVGGRLEFKQCVLGLSDCSDEMPCPVHESWRSVRQHLSKSLHERTVSDLVRARRAKVPQDA